MNIVGRGLAALMANESESRSQKVQQKNVKCPECEKSFAQCYIQALMMIVLFSDVVVFSETFEDGAWRRTGLPVSRVPAVLQPEWKLAGTD